MTDPVTTDPVTTDAVTTDPVTTDAVPTDASEPPVAAVSPAAVVPAWRDVLESLVAGRDLGEETAAGVMAEVMAGRADDATLAGVIVGLRAKGETVAEVTGMARAMLAAAVPLSVPGPVVDVVGTGGDGAGTVNISTAAAVVAAAAGVRVVKHGNRAATSRAGSADVLEALGVAVDPGPEAVARQARELGVAFCFARRFHPAMRYAAGVRRSLGVRTVFNLLGPLTNPARPAAAAVGVADAAWAGPLVAGVLARQGVAALVFRGRDGLDELTTTAVNDVWVVVSGEVAPAVVDTTDLGLARATVADLAGGDAVANAGAIRDVLAGAPGPLADAVVVNAAAALVAADLAGAGVRAARAAEELTGRLAAATGRARDVVTSGRAGQLLARWAADAGG